jgi:integrase/recombinase XerD
MEKHYQDFLRDLEVRNYSPLSLLKYARCLRIFFGYLKRKGIVELKAIGRDELKAYQIFIASNPAYSPGYIGFNIRTVKLFFKYLKKSGIVLFDFSVFLKFPKLPKALPKEPLTLSEVKLMLETPDLRTWLGIRDRAILETFYSTGIRVQEMSRLGMADLDLENGFLFVREGKGKKDRVVPLGRHAAFYIQSYLDTVRPFLSGRNSLKPSELWLNQYGRPLDKGDIVIMVRKCRKKAGIETQVTAHSFRRTLAVELIRNECDFLSVKEILGHSLSRTTLRYCALSGVELKEALEKCHPRHMEQEVEDATPNIKGMGH